MDLITAYNDTFDAIIAFADAPRSLLHVHAGMIIYLGCQLLLGTRRGSLVAVILTVQLAVLHEVMNRLFHGSWRWEDTSKDLVLTMFWPTMCYAVSQLRRWHWARRASLTATKQPGSVAALAYA
jgi:hypothetical protein